MSARTIVIGNLRKSYGSFEAVKGIDLEIVPGRVNALLGPNGAGKTTTLKSILGLVEYSGEIKILGKTVEEVRDRISFVPEDKSFYENLTPEKAIKMCSMVLDNFLPSKAEELMRHFELPMGKKISSFSHGMRTAAYLSIAMAQSADIFIFDEPTWGLDPLRRDEVLDMIRGLSDSGKTVLYTSHIIPEIEKIADVFSIMYKGEILYSGELKGLDERFTLFCLPAGTELDRNGYLAVVRETGAVKVLTDDKNAMEKLGKIGSAKEEKVDLEVFFSLLVRGNKNAL